MSMLMPPRVGLCQASPSSKEQFSVYMQPMFGLHNVSSSCGSLAIAVEERFLPV